MPSSSDRFRNDDPLSQRLAGAFLISILAHTSFFGVLQIGNQLRWWDAQPFSLFHKVRLTPEEIERLRQKQRQLEEERADKEHELVFIQVTDPSEDPPPDSKFYSSASSRAANPQPDNLDQPKIEGTQTKIARIEDAPRTEKIAPSSPPQPTPAPTPAKPVEAAPPPLAVPPNPESVVRPVAPQLVARDDEPRREEGIGDLALVKPLPPKASPSPTPSPSPPPSPVAAPATTEPVKKPVTVPPPRPRTIIEAKMRQELLAGEKMKQEGGVPVAGRRATLDVQGKSYGAYDEALALAVQSRWFALLEQHRYLGEKTGRVVVSFKLSSDGTVKIVEPVESTVDSLLESICIHAIRDPAPYAAWPSAMLREIGKNYREVRFTFFYN